jgi:predicted HD phosphohydrolase
MSLLSSLDDLARLYATRGELTYGQGVTQVEHALQCAALAEADGSGAMTTPASAARRSGVNSPISCR